MADNLFNRLGRDPVGALVEDPPGSSVEAMMARGQRLIEAGVIRQIEDVRIVSTPNPVFASVVLQGGRVRGGRYLQPRICGGSGFTQEEARVRAYGEAAERYCAASYDERDLLFGSYRDLGDAAVSPDTFALYTPEQYEWPGFEYRPFVEESPVNWVQGYSLTHQRPVLIPAAFVYLPYWPIGGETPIGWLPSTGLACGTSYVEAALRGLLEVIERDAIMIMWLLQTARQRIDPATSPNERVKSFTEASENGIIQVFDLTTDVPVPTRFALLTDMYRGRSLVGCGAAADWDASAAVEKAVREALVVRRAVEKIIRTYPPRNYGTGYERVRGLDDHMNLYTNPEMGAALEFLTSMNGTPEGTSDSPMAGRESQEQLNACLRALEERGLEAIGVDVTRPEVADSGLCAVRVIVPGMIPLSFGAKNVCAGGRRLVEMRRALGKHLPDGPMRLNPIPHPFA